MAEPGDKLTQRYRDLAREEPPAALDAAILAASRRAVGAKPSASRRWAVPVSIAAVLVLAFGVTLQMQREDPHVAYAPPERAPPPAATPQQPMSDAATAAAPAERGASADLARKAPVPKPLAKVAPPRARSEPLPEANVAADKVEAFAIPSAPQAAPPAAALPAPALPATVLPPPASSPATPAAPAAQAPASAAESRTKERSLNAAPAMRMQAAPLDPAQELERIAKLREEGRHEDADKALDEFRRRHPSYRIPDAMWERVRAR